MAARKWGHVEVSSLGRPSPGGHIASVLMVCLCHGCHSHAGSRVGEETAPLMASGQTFEEHMGLVAGPWLTGVTPLAAAMMGQVQLWAQDLGEDLRDSLRTQVSLPRCGHLPRMLGYLLHCPPCSSSCSVAPTDGIFLFPSWNHLWPTKHGRALG
jgi:hypothetical protein